MSASPTAPLREDSTLNRIKIKALGPDNGVAIRGLIRLFSHVYGETFPVKGVYDPEFWAAQLGKRFVSIVAEDGGDIVAHLAVHQDGALGTDSFISLPVIDPAYRHSAADITHAAAETVRRLARRQGWRSISGFVYEDVRAMQAIPDAILRSKEVAILPGYLPARPVKARGERLSPRRLEAERGLRRHALMTQRIFSPSAVQPLAIFVPERHREICRILYAPLGLDRALVSDPQTPCITPSIDSIERSYHRGLGTHHIFVRPSGVAKHTALEPKGWDGSKALFVYVDLGDPACPEFCASLEDQGYRFSGIVPLVRGRDSIVFFKETEPFLDRSPFTSPRARMLSRYIETYDIAQAIDVLVPNERILTPVSSYGTGAIAAESPVSQL